MVRRFHFLAVLGMGAVSVAGGAAAAQTPLQINELRIDPLLLVTVKEYRNVVRSIGTEIFPGWAADSVPMLLYRPGVQELLVRARRQPPGFSRFNGITALGDEVIYARNDSTVMAIDGQNTTTELDSARVLVVADRYSRGRDQLRAMFERSTAEQQRWLEEWGFIERPIDELMLMLHEAFHVHQGHAANKGADEAVGARYPLLEPENNALVALEGLLLRDALKASSVAERRARIDEFVAVRTTRRATLDSVFSAYEDGVEFSEGTAKYVEFRFLQLGEQVDPTREMYLTPGFSGYRGVLGAELARRAEEIALISANRDDRFGNRFGVAPLRFRLYGTGGAQGVLLDDVLPSWKSRIFQDGVSLTSLLMEAVPLTTARTLALVERAEAAYGYDTLYANRVAFEAEGRRLIQERVAAILNDSGTVVTIRWTPTSAPLRMGYTPFGVTAVDDMTAIYDLVPIAIRFPNSAVLRMKKTVPVLIDRRAGSATFVVASPPSLFGSGDSGSLDLPELTLTGALGMTISVSGRKVVIQLR